MMGIYCLAISKFNKVEYAYKRLMSLVDTLLEMTFFFTLVQMHALEDTVNKDRK
jgi:hypothetical protein